MRSPEGKDHENIFCYLEIVENEKLVWTDALGPGYRPSLNSFMTAIVTFEDLAGKTRYTARALHKNDADRQKHLDMGFDQGWNKALDQLIEVARQFK
jgi:uncharacterized protein YndB with AHSA1/START domain